MPSQGSLFNNFEDVQGIGKISQSFYQKIRDTSQLTDEERVFLNAATLGDVGVVRQSIEENEMLFNVNCVDYMGRSALHLAIDSEKLDVIEILLDNVNFNCIEESLLHAISKGGTKIVKIIIEHPTFMAGENKLRKMDGGEAFFRTEEKSQFPPDITPLILAAHYNNHEIIQMFLSRNHTIEKPHPISCKCTGCVTKQNYDSLKRSRSRLNAYRSLASPAYMALSSPDPIMTTFELRQEMQKLAEVEKEFKNEYLGLVEQCMDFACELMDLCRGTQEVEAVLSGGWGDISIRDPLARLKMALRYEEKKFVAHPNCQQHMTSIWYGSEMGFLQSLNWWRKLSFGVIYIPFVPFFCAAYIIAPNSKASAVMRCPVIKFVTHTASHICFLILLAAATFRLTENSVHISSTEELTSTQHTHLPHHERAHSLLKETLRPANTLLTHVQICIVFWILGLLWMECKQIYNTGARSYLTDYYNFMDFGVLSMYLASYLLRFITDFRVQEADRYFNGTQRARMLLMAGNYTDFNYLLAQIKSKQHEPKNYFMEASRFHWKPNDPEIVSDVLFAIANVISFARTTYLMPAFEVLGPLQISLGRMVGDITRFMVLFALVLFAFMVGLHNLYWYYGAQKFKMSLNGQSVYVHAAGAFQGLGHTFYSLFWSMFSQININEISVKTPDVEGRTGKEPVEKSTAIVESVGMCLFGIYHVVIIIVLINMLIAMMSHSFEDIQGDCDVEWKFARTKLWMNYMDDGSTLPVPFNMIPTPKSFLYAWAFCKELFNPHSEGLFDIERARKQTFIKKRRDTVCKNLELKTEETSYTDIMHRLVKRYLFKLERAKDEKENVKDIANVRGEEIELFETPPDGPPPVPETPSRIPYATPPIPEHEDTETKMPARSAPHTNKKTGTRSVNRRTSVSNSGPIATTLAIPQLDAIQRQQKLLDVRLQHLQSNTRENNKMMDDVDFIRRLMTENQKALFNIIQALANIQTEIVNLAQCLRPPSPKAHTKQGSTQSRGGQSNSTNTSSNSAQPRRQSKEDESKV
ncbi:short transient receptor potential channel 3-like [Octopus vulgaris]|uniref:Short transient receptor potential channel 3-like n=3 Tax=Octopus TaxID=6643 RepID=A0AA36BRZ8_OCTVU|nr:short transient receptor potential channel 3-like [Octopus vulgaris]